ncbi:GST-11 protein [Aphelenchoides avenae]|nr:GST-11 protein [Aphelenchus avenae]
MPVIPHYKLTYFDLMGRAEPIRLIFAAAGVEYEDVRISFEQWPALKQTTPYGQLPVLEFQGKPLAQSHAIEKFLGRMFGLLGGDDWEAAKIDEITMALEDVFQGMQPWFKEQDDAKKADIFKEIAQNTIQPFFQRLEKMLESSKSGYLVGDKLSVADLCVFHFVWYFDFKILPGQLHHKFPILEGFIKKIKNEPKIKEWMAKRPVTVR